MSAYLIKVWQAHYKCMKWIWYEFEVDERTLSLHNSMIHVKCQKSTLSPKWSKDKYTPMTAHHI